LEGVPDRDGDEVRHPAPFQLANRLKVWMNRHSGKVVALWREALSSEWGDTRKLGWEIALGLGNFEPWGTESIRELLKALIENAKADRDFLGRSLSRWVQATNGGDALLWRYIVKHVTAEGIINQKFRDELRCAPHDFHDKNFLAERLCRSDASRNAGSRCTRSRIVSLKL